MPIGIQRLNAPRPQPSSQVIFIKPLPGPAEAFAQDFLERIAAICHPIMKNNHLSIMTLEEHEPNPEFIGRNFNAGEIIQLVLKAPYSGNWLSFRSVQMVVMHELAHCVQMNHSGAFWKVNNQYKGELKELWGKKYTGNGLWGRGQTLLSGEYHTDTNMENEVLPANLCGGTFRSSRKRKRDDGKPKETYAEAQQRRIAKKFGVNGQALGDDKDTRVKLESGKKPKGKPRVAGSARGRELRAAAALARFDQVKDEETKIERGSLSDGSETESDEDGDVGEAALDIDGSRMKDSNGRGMFTVCQDEDRNDVNVKREIEELRKLEDAGGAGNRSENPSWGPDRSTGFPSATSTNDRADPGPANALSDTSNIRLYDIPLYVEEKGTPAVHRPTIKIHRPSTSALKSVRTSFSGNPASNSSTSKPASSTNVTEWKGRDGDDFPESQNKKSLEAKEPSGQTTPSTPSKPLNPAPEPNQPEDLVCPICSMTNEPASLLCIACSHVLDVDKVTRYWRCTSEACQGSEYINSADCGLCGVCGARRPHDGT